MILQDAAVLAWEEILHHGLYEQGWRLGSYNRKRQFGTCDYNRKTIYLSRPLVLLNDRELILDVILHEIAHAKTEGHAHDALWQSVARAIGARPEPYQWKFNPVPGRYQATCQYCGYISHKHRRMKLRRACPRCCRLHNQGRFSEQFVLVYASLPAGNDNQ